MSLYLPERPNGDSEAVHESREQKIPAQEEHLEDRVGSFQP
jgi:hypothetical protein